jgi:hypothetical protein
MTMNNNNFDKTNLDKPIKKLIKKTIILQRYKSINQYIESRNFTWGEVKKILQDENIQLQDDDILEIQYVDEESYNDSYREPSYQIRVTRFIEETDQEYQERKLKIQKNREEKLKNIEIQERKLLQELKLKYELNNNLDNNNLDTTNEKTDLEKTNDYDNSIF